MPAGKALCGSAGGSHHRGRRILGDCASADPCVHGSVFKHDHRISRKECPGPVQNKSGAGQSHWCGATSLVPPVGVTARPGCVGRGRCDRARGVCNPRAVGDTSGDERPPLSWPLVNATGGQSLSTGLRGWVIGCGFTRVIRNVQPGYASVGQAGIAPGANASPPPFVYPRRFEPDHRENVYPRRFEPDHRDLSSAIAHLNAAGPLLTQLG